MTQHDLSAALLAPDFYHYAAAPIAAVTEGDDALVVSWPDGRQLSCHRFWLRENTLGHGGIDPATREGIMDPAELSDAMQIMAFELTASGDLSVTWAPDGADESLVSTYHSGWLRHIAEGQHLPESWVPAPEAWTASALPAPPSNACIGVEMHSRPLHIVYPIASSGHGTAVVSDDTGGRLRGPPIGPCPA